MRIKREEVDQRKVDFSDVRPSAADGSSRRNPARRVPDPDGISVYELSHAIKVPRSRANDIVRGRRTITTDTAFVLDGTSARRLSSGSTRRPATIST